jgi:uncharacterized protein (TIGR03435 family)
MDRLHSRRLARVYVEVLLGIALSSLHVTACALGQANEDHSHFEVASIRPVQGTVRETYTGPETGDLGRLVLSKISLRKLIAGAYSGDRLTPERISGPLWIDVEYSIEATIPAGSTREDARRMMQNLLAERFGLKFHFENKDVRGFDLTISQKGFKLTPSKVKAGSEPPDAEALVMPGRGRVPDLAGPGSWVLDFDDDSEVQKTSFYQCSMAQLVEMLSSSYGQRAVPIMDKTGIQGVFDFHLILPSPSYKWSPSAGSNLPPSAFRRPADSPDSSIADLSGLSGSLENKLD